MEADDIKLTLSLQEANAIISVLGELPTKTGAFNLMIKIENQVKAQQTKKD